MWHKNQRANSKTFIDVSQFSLFCRLGVCALSFNTLEIVLLLLNCYRSTASKCIMKFRPTYYNMLMGITYCHHSTKAILWRSLRQHQHFTYWGTLLRILPFETLLRGVFFSPEKLNENDANTWQPSLSANHSSVWFQGFIYLFVTVFMLRNTLQTSLTFLYVRSFFLPFQNFHPQKNGDTDDDGDATWHMCK